MQREQSQINHDDHSCMLSTEDFSGRRFLQHVCTENAMDPPNQEGGKGRLFKKPKTLCTVTPGKSLIEGKGLISHMCSRSNVNVQECALQKTVQQRFQNNNFENIDEYADLSVKTEFQFLDNPKAKNNCMAMQQPKAKLAKTANECKKELPRRPAHAGQTRTKHRERKRTRSINKIHRMEGTKGVEENDDNEQIVNTQKRVKCTKVTIENIDSSSSLSLRSKSQLNSNNASKSSLKKNTKTILAHSTQRPCTSKTRKQKQNGRPTYPALPLVCSLQRCSSLYISKNSMGR